MAFDLAQLGEKLARYRAQFQLSPDEVANETGISSERLVDFENGRVEPTGDEILILADFYKCDYKFFLSNERLAPFEQTEALYRRFGTEFKKEDRRSVQEFLFLAECEAYLEGLLQRRPREKFAFRTSSSSYKVDAEKAASELRHFLGYDSKHVTSDVYSDFRSIGIRVFRRKLMSSNISGLFFDHPVAGKCIMINYAEDIYRQRFTAAHEAGHSILDSGEAFVVSLKNDRKSISEMRANVFASRYLMPKVSLHSIPDSKDWDPEKSIKWASKFKVSTEALAYALQDNGLIDRDTVEIVKSVRVPRSEKEDPELPKNLPPNSRARKEELLTRGLSDYYVRLGFEAYREGLISASRLKEVLLADAEEELNQFAAIYGERLRYDG